MVYALGAAAQLIRLLAANPGAGVFLPVSQGRWGFVRDAVLVGIARLGRRRTYLHLHGGAFDRFYRAMGPLMRVLIRWTLASAEQVWVLTPPGFAGCSMGSWILDASESSRMG